MLGMDRRLGLVGLIALGAASGAASLMVAASNAGLSSIACLCGSAAPGWVIGVASRSGCCGQAARIEPAESTRNPSAVGVRVFIPQSSPPRGVIPRPSRALKDLKDTLPIRPQLIAHDFADRICGWLM